ncbi:MAG: aspartyl protease family protein [Verrucomicrobia bacterium]|nr:aspartyl protease family protein [Verrucomicrobiota bacterium]
MYRLLLLFRVALIVCLAPCPGHAAGSNEQLPPDPAVPERGGTTDTPASTDVPAGHVLIPSHRDRNDNYLLSAKVNGHPVWMALDSGADTIAFHKPLAAEFGVTLREDKNGSAIGPDGKVFALSTGLVESIELPGGITVNKQRFPFSDLGAFSETAIDGKPARLGGLLGSGFMTPSRMILDCGEGRVLMPRQAKPGDYLRQLHKEGGRVVTLLTGKTGKLYLPVEFGETRAALLVDTGAAVSALYAEHPVAKPLKREPSGEVVKTLGKTVRTENAIMPDTTVGSVSLPNLRYVLLPDGRARQTVTVEDREVCGIIGNNHLGPLRFVIDFGVKQAVIPVNRFGKKKP